MNRAFFSSFIMKNIKLVLLSVFVLSVPFSTAQSKEAILNFYSDITILPDGRLNIVEKITINAQGQRIKRGIYRDLPTSYAHPNYGYLGFLAKTPIAVAELQRNGKTEPFHIKKLENGIRVFFGSEHRMLKHGEHTYIFSYIAERQISSIDNTAQLYWNVAGNGWDFNINQASARIKFNGSPSILEHQVFTGAQGSTRTDAQFEFSSNRDLVVKADKALAPRNGMTVRVLFDGSEMSLPQKSEFALLYEDNKKWFWGAGLLALMGIFFVICWYRIGRDPKRGIVIAQYKPVEGLSAAAHRSVYYNKVDDTSFSVGVLSAAIKGWITISKPNERTFKLTKNDTESSSERNTLSPSEKILINNLFNGRSSVYLDGRYDSQMQDLKKRYDKFLKKEFADKSHQPHKVVLIIGGLIGLTGIALMSTTIVSAFEDRLVSVAIWTYILVWVLAFMFKGLNNFFVSAVTIVSLTLAGLSFYHGIFLLAIALAAFAVIFGAFAYLMPAPKQEAVKTLDQIEGFRLYLAKAEHDSLKRLSVPEKTPQLYEELLPFAIALDLETQWSDQFTDVLAAANWDSNKKSHHTTWYTSGDSSSISSFAPAIAAGLASSVVSASTPPSSNSSSGGGGGFSGGGGGGGGGGGW